MRSVTLARGRLQPSATTPFRLPFPRSSASPSVSLRQHRPYALKNDGRGNIIASRGPPIAPRTTFLRAEDAKEIEDKFLKFITPTGNSPLPYHSNLLPEWTGIKGDANVKLHAANYPEQVIASFLEHMLYPSELGHGRTFNMHSYNYREAFHWADEQVFGLPPVAVVSVHANLHSNPGVLTYAEVHWRRRILKVWELKKNCLRSQDEMQDPTLGELDDDDFEVTREAAEYPIPPRWLDRLKRFKWPAPPKPEALEFPSMYRAEASARESLTSFANESFPHPQFAVVGRPFWNEDDDEKEEELDEEDEELDPDEESNEQLAVGNAFFRMQDVPHK